MKIDNFVDLITYCTPEKSSAIPNLVKRRLVSNFDLSYFVGLQLNYRSYIGAPYELATKIYATALGAYSSGKLSRDEYSLALDAAAYCHDKISLYPRLDHFEARQSDFNRSPMYILKTIHSLSVKPRRFDPVIDQYDSLFERAMLSRDADEVRRIFFYLATSCVLIDADVVKGVGLFARDISRLKDRLPNLGDFRHYLYPLTFFRLRSLAPYQYNYPTKFDERVYNILPYSYTLRRIPPVHRRVIRFIYDTAFKASDLATVDSILEILLSEPD